MPATTHLFHEGEQVRWRWVGEDPPDTERVGTIAGRLMLGDHGTSAYWIMEDGNPLRRYYVPVDEVHGLVRD